MTWIEWGTYSGSGRYEDIDDIHWMCGDCENICPISTDRCEKCGNKRRDE